MIQNRFAQTILHVVVIMAEKSKAVASAPFFLGYRRASCFKMLHAVLFCGFCFAPFLKCRMQFYVKSYQIEKLYACLRELVGSFSIKFVSLIWGYQATFFLNHYGFNKKNKFCPMVSNFSYKFLLKTSLLKRLIY